MKSEVMYDWDKDSHTISGEGLLFHLNSLKQVLLIQSPEL